MEFIDTVKLLFQAATGLMVALAIYYSAKAKKLSESNSTKLNEVKDDTKTAAALALAAKHAAEKAVSVNVNAVEDSKVALAEVHRLVNGQREVMVLKIAELEEKNRQLKGQIASPR